jgi:16S rRNA C967 or C1407 C5-methylase (RsmB/RsmF family)
LIIWDAVSCLDKSGENESNVRYVLDTYLDMHLEQQCPVLGGPGLTEQDRLRAAARISKCDRGGGVSGQMQALQSVDNLEEADLGHNGIDKDEKQQGQQQQRLREGSIAIKDAVRDPRWLTPSEARLVQRFDPRGDTIGFFVAKFRKQER